MVILFNKPYGVLSQFTPEGGHPALDGFGFPPGVYAAGRLDHDSEGALLLTDDGRLVKRLLDPKNAHPRTYLAQVDGEITDEALQMLRKGVVIKGYRTRSCQAERALPPEECRAFIEKGYMRDFEKVFSLRLSGKERLIGVVDLNVFKILWYDKEHRFF